MEIRFCNPEALQQEIVHLIQSLILPIEEEKIKKIYQVFRARFNGKDYPTDAEIVLYYMRPSSDVVLLQNFGLENTDEFIGIDFPSWFNFDNSKSKLMVVGIDPLRSEEFLRNKISIGSPFGIQDTQYDLIKGKGKSSLYWELISTLAQTYSVYVTDTFKVYFKEQGGNKRSYDCKRFTNPPASTWQEEIHQKIFAEEVRIVKPDAIITLGTHPVRWFTSCKKENFEKLKQMMEKKDAHLMHTNIPVLPFMHLSGQAKGQAMQLYGVSKEIELPNKYVSVINDYFRVRAKV